MSNAVSSRSPLEMRRASVRSNAPLSLSYGSRKQRPLKGLAEEGPSDGDVPSRVTTPRGPTKPAPAEVFTRVAKKVKLLQSFNLSTRASRLGGLGLDARARLQATSGELSIQVGRLGPRRTSIFGAASLGEMTPGGALTSRPKCSARAAWLSSIPLFEGVSQALLEKLANQVVRHYVDDAALSEVVTQGHLPEGNTEYLFLLNTDTIGVPVSVHHDSRQIAELVGPISFGQEAIVGVTECFLFTIRLPPELLNQLWVIPCSDLQAALKKESLRKDAEILQENAYRLAVGMLSKFYQSKVRIRLLDSAEFLFKKQLMAGRQLRIFAAGATICEEGAVSNSCHYIFKGEVVAESQGGSPLKLLYDGIGNPSVAWWGVMEILSAPSRRPCHLRATTDCIIWEYDRDFMRDLLKEFPYCKALFEKVALEHMRLMEGGGASFHEVAAFRHAHPSFLAELDKACERHIHLPGNILCEEGTPGDAIFLVSRGRVSVRKGHHQSLISDDDEDNESNSDEGFSPRINVMNHEDVVLNTFGRGTCFGELAVLGLVPARLATVVCETVCDIRRLAQTSLMRILGHYPSEIERLIGLATARGVSAPMEQLCNVKAFSGLSPECLECLETGMRKEHVILGQQLIEQGLVADSMHIVLSGRVCLEIDGEHLMELECPALVGESIFLQEGASSVVTARCMAFSAIWTFPRKLILEIFESFPEAKAHFESLAMAGRDQLRSAAMCKFTCDARRGSTNGEAGSPTNSDSKSSCGAAAAQSLSGLGKVFKGCSNAFLEALSLEMERKVFLPGEIVIAEGDIGDFAIMVQAGSCAVEVAGVRVGEVHEHSIVGEACLLGELQKRSATVRALGLMHACSLSRQAVLDALQRYPNEQAQLEFLLQEIIGVRRDTRKFIQASANQDPPERRLGSKAPTASESSSCGSPSRSPSVSRPPSSKRNTRRASTVKLRGGQAGGGSISMFTRRAQLECLKPPLFSKLPTVPALIEEGDEEDEDVEIESTMGTQHSLLPLRLDNRMGKKLSMPRKSACVLHDSRVMGGACIASGPQTPPLRIVRQLDDWRSKRRKAIQKASEMRARSLAKSGAFLPLLPGEQGFRAPAVGSGTPFAACNESDDDSQSAKPLELRFRRLQSIYSRPVWQETKSMAFPAIPARVAGVDSALTP